MRSDKKQKLRQLRHWRIRKKVSGYVQFIDDEGHVTLASACTTAKNAPDRDKLGANVASAKKIGALAAEQAKSKGISAVVFDRSGAPFHGKVKALADAAREAGLKF
jgi:large subunit ribosomal protein L18